MNDSENFRRANDMREDIQFRIGQWQSHRALNSHMAGFDPKLEDLEIQLLEADILRLSGAIAFNCSAPDLNPLRDLFEAELRAARVAFAANEADLTPVPPVDGTAASILAHVDASIALSELRESRRVAYAAAVHRLSLIHAAIQEASKLLSAARKRDKLPFVSGLLAPVTTRVPTSATYLTTVAAVDTALANLAAARLAPDGAPPGAEQLVDQIYNRRKSLDEWRLQQDENEARSSIIADDPDAFRKQSCDPIGASLDKRARAKVATP